MMSERNIEFRVTEKGGGRVDEMRQLGIEFVWDFLLRGERFLVYSERLDCLLDWERIAFLNQNVVGDC